MSAISATGTVNGKNVEWLEKVSDEQYNLPSRPKGELNMSKEPSTAQKMLGDFAPKLVERTDKVLFAKRDDVK